MSNKKISEITLLINLRFSHRHELPDYTQKNIKHIREIVKRYAMDFSFNGWEDTQIYITQGKVGTKRLRRKK